MSNKFVILKYTIGCALLLSAGITNAAASDESSAPMFRLGGLTVYPGLSLVEKSNNNIFNSNVTKRFSYISVISPSLVAQAKKGADAYSLSYRADAGRYSKSAADNYVDHSVLGTAELSASVSAKQRISLDYRVGHDDRGSTFGAGTSDPNTWHSAGIDGSLLYGSDESRGKIVLDAGYQDRQYQNNRIVTAAYDKTMRDLGGALHFRVFPKTFIFTQVTDTRIAYKDVASALNGSERRYLLGATWEVTAQTSGNFKVGRIQKKFEKVEGSLLPPLPTFKGVSWEGSLRWTPRKYARFDLVSGRKPSESTGVGDFLMVTNNSLDFSYDLNERSSLHFNAGKVSEAFKGNGTARIDNTKSYGFKAEYKLRSWLVSGVEYSTAAKTSTDLTAYYDRRIIAVSVRSIF